MRLTSAVCLGLLLLGMRAEAVVIQGPTLSVTTNQVTLWWRTDDPSTTEVHFGPTSQSDWSLYPHTSKSSGSLDTLHSLTLRNLAPGTWYYRVRSEDAVGASQATNELTFTISAAEASAAERFGVDGNVRALAVSGDTLYVGGAFSRVYDYRGHLFEVDPASGAPVSEHFPMVDGSVSAWAPDGRGGFYIGGYFRHVGGLRRNNVAHILPDGGVDPDFNPDVTGGSVSGMALVGNTLYLGGSFTSIGGQFRACAGAVDATTGSVLSWNPSLSSSVYAMAVSGTTVYYGGGFSTFLGSSRSRVAAVNGTTGALLPWAPNVNEQVYALAASGSQVYLGGRFTAVNATTRNRVAAVDATTGALTSWNPNVDDQVHEIAPSGSTIYLGGDFSSVGGASRVGVAAVNTTTGAATAWNPDLDVANVRAITVSGSTVYLGGGFTSAGGTPRNRAAAVDATSGALLPWNPDLDGSPAAIMQLGSRMFLGGSFFSSGGGMPRSRAAAINLSTGLLEPWSPNPDGPVSDLAVSGSAVYLAGGFVTVGGTIRSGLAAVDATSGSLLPFNPDVNAPVNAIAVSGGSLLVGGTFTRVGGTNRQLLASVNATTGGLESWNPNVSGTFVNALVPQGTQVFVGGLFTSIGGSPRQNLASVDLATAAATAWSSDTAGRVNGLALGTQGLYVGGDFNAIQGTSRSGLAAVDPVNASLLPWNPAGQLSLEALAVAGTSVYAVWYTIPFAAVEPYASVADGVTGLDENWIAPADFINTTGNGAAWADCTRRRAIMAANRRIVEALPPQGCPVSSPPAILDNQTGDDTWRSGNDGLYDVDFSDDLALTSFELEAWSGPAGAGTRVIAWTQGGTLSGTNAGSDWVLPSAFWSALPEGRSYISVRVSDVDGTTTTLADAFYVQKDTQPPTPPDSVLASPAAPGVTVSWPPASDATSGVAFYRLSRGPSPTGPWQQLVGDGVLTATTFEDTPGPGEHWYQVTPVDRAGNAASTGLPTTSVVIGSETDGGVDTDGGVPDGGISDGGTGETPMQGPLHLAVGCGCQGSGGASGLAFLWAAAAFIVAARRRR